VPEHASEQFDASSLEHRVEAAATLPIVIANEETNEVCALTDGPRNLARLLRNPLTVRTGRAAGKVHASAGDLDDE
jgi:hypothetical protein